MFMTQTHQIIVLAGLGGLAFASLFGGIGWIRVRMMRNWVRTTGQVTTRRGGLSEALPAGSPTFRWQDHTGREFHRTSLVSSSFGPRAGTLVPVRYDPNNPQRAIIDTFVQGGRIFVLIGAIIAVIAVFACFLAWQVAGTTAFVPMSK
jgi:hypothetical protein